MKSRITLRKIRVVIFLIGATFCSNAQIQTQTYIGSYPGKYTWICPNGVTSITVQAWGGGEGGYCCNNSCTGNTGHGGTGGDYAEDTNMAVTPSKSYAVLAGYGNGSNNNCNITLYGGNSSFIGDVDSVVAVGGGNCCSHGTIIFNGGGSGATIFCTSYGTGSGGGGGAGSGGNGGAGGGGACNTSLNGGTGGIGSIVGGSGGTGGCGIGNSCAGNFAPVNGNFPSGAGGGGSYGYTYGGIGANGQVILSWKSISTSINKISNLSNSVEVYPNPGSGKYTISNLETGQKIEVYNYFGQKISSLIAYAPAFLLDIDEEPDGVYLVRILSNDGHLVAQNKIIKIN